MGGLWIERWVMIGKGVGMSPLELRVNGVMKEGYI